MVTKIWIGTCIGSGSPSGLMPVQNTTYQYLVSSHVLMIGLKGRSETQL